MGNVIQRKRSREINASLGFGSLLCGSSGEPVLSRVEGPNLESQYDISLLHRVIASIRRRI